MAEPGATEAAAEQAAAAAHAETSKSKKNRVKKLKAQYVSILELESRVAAGHALDAGQAEKVSPASGPGTFSDLSSEEVEAALEAALGDGPRRRPVGSISRALGRQLELQEANPGYSYFLVLPDPLPDVGVSLQSPMGALFFQTMLPRAEAGEPRAVKMMYQQLLPSAEQAGLPPMQVRLQLLAEYGVDPITEAVVTGSEEEKLAWLTSVAWPTAGPAATGP
ncbi:hypothetical protein ABPG77_011327 [Micractinium sp. CCAP 211/92]